MDTITGFGATRAFRLLWMFEEIGQPLPLRTPHALHRSGWACTPDRRLPAWRLADGTMLRESTALLTFLTFLAFLADPHDTLTCPPGSIQRAQQDARTNDALECLDAPLMMWPLNVQRRLIPRPAPPWRPTRMNGCREGLACWSGRPRRATPGCD